MRMRLKEKGGYYSGHGKRINTRWFLRLKDLMIFPQSRNERMESGQKHVKVLFLRRSLEIIHALNAGMTLKNRNTDSALTAERI